jgi:hypothetical protein
MFGQEGSLRTEAAGVKLQTSSVKRSTATAALLSAAALFTAAGCGATSTTEGQTTPGNLTNTLGLRVVEAMSLFQRDGVRAVASVRWTGDPAGRVLEQTPSGGPISPRQKVRLVVSARGVQLPRVVGLPVARALATLRSRGFRVDQQLPSGGTVDAQHPAPGWSRPGVSVRLKVVHGKAAVLYRVAQAFATQGVPGLHLSNVHCAQASQASVFRCTGAATDLNYRTTLLVTFVHGAITEWQPPVQKKAQKHSAHRKTRHPGNRKAHGSHRGSHNHTHRSRGAHASARSAPPSTTSAAPKAKPLQPNP